jgi:environmental stress-induced protein Ves
MAEIDRDGPFSDYAGFDRTLTVAQGHGLSLNGRVLGAAPFAFRGEEAVAARLAAGPMLVLNAITRRRAFGHRVERRAARGGVAGVSFVTALGGAARVGGQRLGALDTLRLDGAAAAVEAEEGVELLAVTFFPDGTGAVG